MSAHNRPELGSQTAHLVLVEQSGAKHDIPHPSTVEAMIEAEYAMHSASWPLRQGKGITRHKAGARGKARELGGRRGGEALHRVRPPAHGREGDGGHVH